MSSSEPSAGRTWFASDVVGVQSASDYMGIRVPISALRSNACTFSDFADTQSASDQHQLLRMFLRINYRLMRASATGRDARAYIEWDSDGLGLPSFFALHVLYEPDDSGVNCATEGTSALRAIAEADNKLLPRPDTDRSQLMLRADMWGALCATYTNDTRLATTDDFATISPSDVFTSERAGNRFSQTSGGFTPQTQTVQMARTDLAVDLFMLKYCPWYQLRQLPEFPIQCSDDRAAGLLRLSRMVPGVLDDELSSVWEQLKERCVRARGMDGYTEWAREEISHGLFGEQAGYVPAPERALNVYNAQPLPQIRWSDASLSPFAMWVAKFLMEVEAYAFLYKQHVLLLKLLLGVLDVTREASSGHIHFSAILAGPNSTSKSYVFTLLEDMLVPGTVSRATRRTENSFTYNRDQGARVLIDHEMAGDFFGDCAARGPGAARTAQTKEILTSHEATTESCQMEENKRVMVESRSRAHLCYLAATNDWSVGQSANGESGRDDALLSRFDVVFPTRGGKIANKSIMALMAADRNPSAAEKDGKRRLVEWVRSLQQANYWIHRCIYVGAIEDVNMDVAHAVIELLSAETPLAPRTAERILIMARQACIATAIMIHYAFDASPRKDQRALPQHMHELAPLLVVTAEQAKFAVGLYEAELDNQIEQPFAQALRTLPYRPDPDLGFNYVRVLGCDTASQLTDELLMHMPTGSDVSRDLITAHLTKLRSTVICSHPYIPSSSSDTIGVSQDKSVPEQQFFAVRGMSFHVKLTETSRAAPPGLETLMSNLCHVGPIGREITSATVPGHAHLLACRELHEPMLPYRQDGMFMPSQAALVLGEQARDTLQQQSRSNTSTRVTSPVELKELARRGAPDLAQLATDCSVAQNARYPDVYIDAYNDRAPKRAKTQ